MAAASLTDRVRDALVGRAEILEAYLFGSQARSAATSHSDVDVAVYVDREYLRGVRTPFGYDAGLASELMRALSRSDVDLLLLNTAPPLLYHRVLRDGVRLSRPEGDKGARGASPVALVRLRAAARKDRWPYGATAPSGTFAMSPGRLDASVVRRHLLALEHALRH